MEFAWSVYTFSAIHFYNAYHSDTVFLMIYEFRLLLCFAVIILAIWILMKTDEYIAFNIDDR